MKISIILFLSCMSLLAADADIQVTTTYQTNTEENLVFKREVFTRAGQTNLLCVTMFKAGKPQVREQEIYYQGVRLISIATTQPGNSVSIKTIANSPFPVIFNFRPPNNELKTITVWTTNDTVVDAFSCKDGILSPEESSVISGLGLKK